MHIEIRSIPVTIYGVGVAVNISVDSILHRNK